MNKLIQFEKKETAILAKRMGLPAPIIFLNRRYTPAFV